MKTKPKNQLKSKPVNYKSIQLMILVSALSITIIISLVNWALLVSSNTSHASLKVGSDYIGPPQVNIPIVKPVRLSNISVRNVLESRTEQVKNFSSLINGIYSPTKTIFNDLKDYGGWMSSARLYYHGKRINGGGKFYTETASSKLLLNPLLLVKAEFWGLSIWGEGNLKWDKEKFPLEYLAQNNIPLAPPEDSLQFMPPQGKAQVTYNISAFMETVNPLLQKPLVVEQIAFGCQMQNARDFGFRFAYLDLAASSNIKNDQQIEQAAEIIDNFSYMPVAWSKNLTLNHSSPSSTGFEWIETKALPAQATIKLWYDKPAVLEDQADLIFSIVIN